MSRYAIYGDSGSRGAIALVTAMSAKGLAFDFVPETPSLSFVLATRAGREADAYLRTPEGFVLGDLAAALDHLDRIHPEPAWRPTTPVRRVCSRILEDWIELWLPVWPEQAGAVVEGIGAHLDRAGFLLGPSPCRADGSLVAWLEAEVLVDEALRVHVSRHAPAMLRHAEAVRRALLRPQADDAIPISLLPLLGELAKDHHAYLDANREALWEGRDEVEIDLGFGRTRLPAWRYFEARRAAIADELMGLPAAARRAVRQMLDPFGAWYLLTLPGVLSEPTLGDPRAL